MSIRFQSNNLIAILIAAVLMATGVVLYIVNEQTQKESAHQPINAKQAPENKKANE